MSRRKTIESETVIEVPPRTVWDVLMDTAEWAEWNPAFFFVDGAFLPGRALEVHLRLNSETHVVIRPQVVNVDPVERRLAWEGVVAGGAWTMHSWHGFRLERFGPCATRFSQYELLWSDDVPIVRWLGQVRATFQGCRQMNEALKRRCETL